jgi:hypothetical protein
MKQLAHPVSSAVNGLLNFNFTNKPVFGLAFVTRPDLTEVSSIPHFARSRRLCSGVISSSGLGG